jgi:hypothetical protein
MGHDEGSRNRFTERRGTRTHPQGGGHAANGYNWVNAMTEDLGIPKWWVK